MIMAKDISIFKTKETRKLEEIKDTLELEKSKTIVSLTYLHFKLLYSK